jgi:hypothetical protein
MAEIAVRERQKHLAYLTEILSAEIDDRTGRRRIRRITEARLPRIRGLADFNPDAIPGIAAALAALAAGRWIDHRQDSCAGLSTNRGNFAAAVCTVDRYQRDMTDRSRVCTATA